MDLITVIVLGFVVAATGVFNPETKDIEDVAQAPQPHPGLLPHKPHPQRFQAARPHPRLPPAGRRCQRCRSGCSTENTILRIRARAAKQLCP